MIGRLASGLGLMIACFCVATVIALGAVVGYGWSHGRINQESAVQIALLLQGKPSALTGARSAAQAAPPEAPEAPNFEQLAATRSARMRDLELREQSMRHGLEQLEFERTRFRNEKSRLLWDKEDFLNRLDAKEKSIASASQENELQAWEGMSAKQAKDQAVRRIKDRKIDEVVDVLGRMSDNKRRKMIAEFKTEEERDMLADILELIRTGGSEAELIDKTRRKIEEAPVSNP